jgi:hypothetical protein
MTAEIKAEAVTTTTTITIERSVTEIWAVIDSAIDASEAEEEAGGEVRAREDDARDRGESCARAGREISKRDGEPAQECDLS